MMIILLGAPGVGKGTQAELLARKYNLKKFSMGEILREEISLNTAVGRKVEPFIKQGILAPDEIVSEIAEDFLRANCDAHILFDGFPRNLNQALNLEKSLAQLARAANIVLELYLPEEAIIERIVNRRHCPCCGKIYNDISNPPLKKDTCDLCGKKLLKRSDDDIAIIKRRLKIYDEETRPLTDYYKSLGIYQQVNAAGTQDEIQEKLSQIIDACIK